MTSGPSRLGKININIPLCNIGNWLGRVCKLSFVPKLFPFLAEFVSSSGRKLQRIQNSIDLKVQESGYLFWHDCYLLFPSSKLKKKGKKFLKRQAYLLTYSTYLKLSLRQPEFVTWQNRSVGKIFFLMSQVRTCIRI